MSTLVLNGNNKIIHMFEFNNCLIPLNKLKSIQSIDSISSCSSNETNSTINSRKSSIESLNNKQLFYSYSQNLNKKQKNNSIIYEKNNFSKSQSFYSLKSLLSMDKSITHITKK